MSTKAKLLLLPALFVFAAASALALDSVTGPRSEQEAALLLKNGKQALGSGQNEKAAGLLQRFIDRYPAHPEFTETLRLLGEARLKSSQPEKAIRPLRDFVEARDNTLEGLKAKLTLGRAYLESEKLSEALLITTELLNRHAKKPLAPTLHAATLLLKSEILFEKKKDSRSDDALASANSVLARLKNQTAASETTALKGQAHWIALKLKLRTCSKYPSAKRLSEDQAIDQLERRGVCLKEALIDYQGALEAGTEPWVEQSTQAIQEAYAAHDGICRNPPAPLSSRSSLQLKRYKQELAQKTSQGCRSKYRETLDILKKNANRLQGHPLESLQAAQRGISNLIRSL